MGSLFRRVIGLVGVILIKWGIIRVWSVIVRVGFLIVGHLIIWFWLFIIGDRLFVVWRWLILFMQWIWFFVVFYRRVVQGNLGFFPVQRFAGRNVVRLLWIDGLLVGIIVHLVQQLSLVATFIVTIQLLPIRPSVA